MCIIFSMSYFTELIKIRCYECGDSHYVYPNSQCRNDEKCSKDCDCHSHWCKNVTFTEIQEIKNNVKFLFLENKKLKKIIREINPDLIDSQDSY